MAHDGETKPCTVKDCGGTLTYQSKTLVPGIHVDTAFIDANTGRGAMPDPKTAPAWSCSKCNFIEWS